MTEISRDIYFSFDFYRSVQFHNIGQSICLPSHCYGPHKRDFYILHFIKNGKGIFEIDGTRYYLTAGQFFFISPEKWTYYEADAVDPWTYYWVMFSGEDILEVLKTIGLSDHIPIGSLHHPDKLELSFEALFSLIENNNQNSLYIQAKLLELLSLFSQNFLENTQQYQYSERLYSNPYLQQFFEYIHHNYARSDLNIEDIADHLSVHRTYLNKIIKKELSQTPNEYLLNFRMNKSVLLLESSSQTIAEIANLVGYESPYSFSRAFSAIKGQPPSSYRKQFYHEKEKNYKSQQKECE